MKRWILLSAIFLVMAAANSAQAFVTVDIFKDAYIDDYDQSTTIDGIPNAITNSQALFIGNGILSDGNVLEARGIMTFDVSSFAGKILDSAKLTGIGSRNPGQTLNVYFYSGNGVVELADYNQPGLFVGELDLAQTGSYLDLQPFDMDITAQLQALLNDNAQYAEIRVSSNAMDPFVDAVILAGEASDPYSLPDGQQGPQLILNVKNAQPVPEPATMLLFGTGLVGAFRRKRA